MLGVVSVCTCVFVCVCVCVCVHTQKGCVRARVCVLFSMAACFLLYLTPTLSEGSGRPAGWAAMVTDVRKMNFDLLCPISYPADSHVMARRIS